MLAVVDNLDADPDHFGREIAVYVIAEIHALVSKLATVETKEARLAALPVRARRAVEAAAAMRERAGWSHARAEEWYQRALTAYAEAMHDRAMAADATAA